MINTNVWLSVDGFLDNPIEGVNPVVMVSEYIFLM